MTEYERVREKALLTDEEIETEIRKVFPLFELDEEGEEDRKETTLNLLKTQLDKVLKTEGIEIRAREERDES